MRRASVCALFCCIGWLGSYPLAFSQEIPETTPCESRAASRASVAEKILNAFKAEAKRYATDSVALVKAPLSWDSEDRQRAAGVALVLGGLFLADEELDRQAQEQRSGFTDRVSGATTRLGGRDAWRVSAALIAGGIIFESENTRDMGREALEASVLTSVLSKYVLKPAFGRKRPDDTGGETAFDSFSHHSSFPSAHATQAFAVASVVAMRSNGWIIPTLAYSAATLVALDRVNDRAHFASDVFAGAVLGIATGRFLVNRHRSQDLGERSTSLELVPIEHGLAARVRF